MKSIAKMVTTSYEVKHSRFEARLYPVFALDEALEILSEINQTFADASHRSYAYIIGENQEHQKANDDGEPSQTAGMPILEVLKKNAVTNVLCVVIRYYGGIKLGAGGLIRAYAKGATLTLEEASFTRKVMVVTLDVIAAFDHIGVLEHLIKAETLLERSYGEKVTFRLKLKKEALKSFISLVEEKTQGQAQFRILKEEKTYQ